MDIYNGQKDPAQGLFDAFNTFIFHSDKRVFGKMLQRIRFFHQTLNLPGDIVECGVFKGSGMATWLKLLEILSPNNRRVIGFDFFQEEDCLNSLVGTERETMNEVIQRCQNKEELSVSGVTARLRNVCSDEKRFLLVPGNVCTTAKWFCEKNPGFRISILYLDMDLGEPTYQALVYFWDRILPGGIIVLDEYGYHVWTESDGVDRFLKEKGLKIQTTGCAAPSAYIQKEKW